MTTYRLTVLLGNKLAAGSSSSSSLLQLTFLPSFWTLCGLIFSSLQLQPLLQIWLGSEADSRSSISTRRPGNSRMPTPGATIVPRLGLTSAAPPPPVIPYLHPDTLRGSKESWYHGLMEEYKRWKLSAQQRAPIMPEKKEEKKSAPRNFQRLRYVTAAGAHGALWNKMEKL